MNKNKLRVFCGYANTGGLAYKIAEGLRKNGIKADSIVIEEHEFAYGYHKKQKYLSSKHTFINKLLKYFYFIKHAFKYDVFIFNTRGTLLSRNGDLKLLKIFGKKTGMIYVGCDIRDMNYYLNSTDKYTVCKNCSDSYRVKVGCVMEKKISETASIQKEINASFSHPFDAQILNGKFNYLYLLLELEEYKPNYNINNKIRIVHSPSDEGIKGTNYILAAINELKKSGIEFEFELLKDKTHNEVKEAISNADILIDQMVAGWYGLISIEAMALGKTTVCYLRDELYNYIPDIPVINLNPDNLADGLKRLIQEKDKLKQYGIAGRKFTEKYHDYRKNSLSILQKILENNN
ncbi:MAG: glycosyltransferase family 1 protein [Ignavibacteriae bacterium]|nr:MAG: glycosyltransferase family 1 protein [Ignavibacteriota bacterium]